MSRASGFLGIQVKPLYSSSIPSITGKFLQQIEVQRDEKPVKIQIFEKGLKQIKDVKNIEQCQWMEFQFDLIFTKNVSTQKIQFEKEYYQGAYKFKNTMQLQACAVLLKDKINQKTFHNSFEILYKLGKGSYGTVFAAKNKQTSELVAMKSLNKEAAYSEVHGKKSLMKQIQILRALKHNNIVHLYEVFETQTSLYLEFDLLEGGNLQQYFLENYRFQSFQIKQIMKGILLGLKEIHKLKIMHRDLKPQNILFVSKNCFEPVIADFGLAQYVDADKYLFVRCGSAGFVAPEVINSKDQTNRYDTSCDLFSLGILFHILIYGKSIFPSQEYNGVLAQNKACKFNFNNPIYQNTDPIILSLLKSLLQKNPTQRISAQQALQHEYFNTQQNETVPIRKSDSSSQKQEVETKQDNQQRQQVHKQEQNDVQDRKNIETTRTQPRVQYNEDNYHMKFQRLQKSYFRSRQPNYLVNNF